MGRSSSNKEKEQGAPGKEEGMLREQQGGHVTIGVRVREGTLLENQFMQTLDCYFKGSRF
jgi:hypothetical protein